MRAYTSSLCLLIPLLLCHPVRSQAQVSEEALGAGPHLWIGGQFSNFRPDYNPVSGRLDGVTIFADYFLSRRLGAEAEVHLFDLNKPAGQTQKDFLIGPIVNVYHYKAFTPFVKGLAGAGTVNYPFGIGYGSYFAYGVGGGLEYHLNSRFKVRGEYEHEGLPGAPGYVITQPLPSNGLTPTGYSAGISYRIY